HGIDFTFGFFTAVEFLAEEIRNMIYDAAAGRAYFIAEAMGRSAGWLGYGAAIAGEASLVISVEDIDGEFAMNEESIDPKTNEKRTRRVMNLDAVVGMIVDTMLARDAEGKEFGVIVIAEGLAEYMPSEALAGIPRDDHGHIAVGDVNLCRVFADRVSKSYKERSGKSRKVNGVQIGYE
ncbi:MAG: 6-phosphofructokinase, partial [Planctomycetales bacterium]|nr:6-phosphofructokinase [Planctomycetales bacterium]